MKTCIRKLLGYHIPPKTPPADRVTWGWDAEVLVAKPYPTSELRQWIDEQRAAVHTHYVPD